MRREHEQHEPVREEVARGRDERTPLFLLGSVAASIWAVVALVATAALLVWWLV